MTQPYCPECQEAFDHAIDRGDPLEEGRVLLCYRCGTWLAVEDGRMRPTTPEEREPSCAEEYRTLQFFERAGKELRDLRFH